MKRIFITILTLLFTFNIYAGDVANFINLGFSPKGEYFLFGEHGVEQDREVAFANMWLVDVEKNSFVKGGVFSKEYKTVIEPGESSLGALLNLIEVGSDKIRKAKIDYLDQGRPLYIRVNDDDNVDSLSFRDFITSRSFKLNLVKDVVGSGESVSSSFHIELEVVTGGSSTKSYILGNKNYKRKGVNNYKIERVINSSNGKGLVVVLSKEVYSNGEFNIRYMVETVSFN